MKIFIRRAKEGIWNNSLKLSNNICFSAAALFLPSLAYAVSFTPTYSVTDLGLLPGSVEAISGEINDQGDAIGTAIADNDKGILFHKGKIVDVVPTAVSSFASGINASGKVAGYMYNGTAWVGFTYKNGTVTGFNVPGSNQTAAESLNDIGQTAGYYSPSTTPINSADHIFVKQPNGTFSDLGEFGTDPSALSINNQGRVLIGVYDVSTPGGSTYISRPGSKSLEKIPSLVAGGLVSPGQMNQFSEVVGSAAIDILDEHEHAYTFYNGKIKDLGGMPLGTDTWGNGINNLNQTVGGGSVGGLPIKNAAGVVIGTTPEYGHGWVDVDGKLRDVNGLLNVSASGWVITEARSINDLGRVLADANFNGGPTHVVVLTPNALLPNLVP